MNDSLKKLLKKSVFFSLLFLLNLIPQAQVNLDSLWGVWNDEAASDSSRAQAMLKIASEGYLYSHPDSAFYFAQMLYDFANEKGIKRDMANALSTQGVSYHFRGEFPEALDYYEQCLVVLEEIPDKNSMSRILNNIGIIYSSQGNYPKALEYYKLSLEIKEELSDKSGMASAMNNIGLIYMNNGDYPKALGYFQRSLKVKEEVSDNSGIAPTLNNIGLIYKRQKDNLKALEYFQRSLDICEQLNNKSAMAGILSNIGAIFMIEGDDSNALECFQRSLNISEEVSDKRGIASAKNNIGEVYMKQGDYLNALKQFRQSITIYEEIPDKRGLAITYFNMGQINIKQRDHAQAIIWCRKSLLISEEINILDEEKNACQCLYDSYKALGNDNKALQFHERITRLNDSLQAEETSKKLQQMEFARQMLADSLTQEKEKLSIQIAHEAEVRKKERARNIFILSASLLLIGAVVLYWRIVYIRRAKAAIEKEKDRSDKLLLNILPSEIAEELKEKGKAQARNFEKVSILFTDFKEFTQTSEKLSAEELVGEINECFEAFDGICGKYGIEKIKTIGDSYMAAGGLPVPSGDSVRNTVLAGLEMAECMNKRKQDRDARGKIAFEMRVGIHTGPVVAGIVGVKKFQYDIWGDTVNTASRMESAGEAGRVNISQSTYELIKEDPAFRFQSRGKVKAKGKGDIDMWFVETA